MLGHPTPNLVAKHGPRVFSPLVSWFRQLRTPCSRRPTAAVPSPMVPSIPGAVCEVGDGDAVADDGLVCRRGACVPESDCRLRSQFYQVTVDHGLVPYALKPGQVDYFVGSSASSFVKLG